jgi:hypothetical protein
VRPPSSDVRGLRPCTSRDEPCQDHGALSVCTRKWKSALTRSLPPHLDALLGAPPLPSSPLFITHKCLSSRKSHSRPGRCQQGEPVLDGTPTVVDSSDQTAAAVAAAAGALHVSTRLSRVSNLVFRPEVRNIGSSAREYAAVTGVKPDLSFRDVERRELCT